jgi:hypothetical protein
MRAPKCESATTWNHKGFSHSTPLFETASKGELTFPDAMHEFDARDDDRSVSEALEPEHRDQTQLDGAVILFN